MRKPFVAGNWKMFKTATEARRLVSEMLSDLQTIEQVDRVLCPPALSIPAVSQLLAGTAIGLGAQNMYWEEIGI